VSSGPQETRCCRSWGYNNSSLAVTDQPAVSPVFPPWHFQETCPPTHSEDTFAVSSGICGHRKQLENSCCGCWELWAGVGTWQGRSLLWCWKWSGHQRFLSRPMGVVMCSSWPRQASLGPGQNARAQRGRVLQQLHQRKQVLDILSILERGHRSQPWLELKALGLLPLLGSG
jgi:hypothetical protein